MFSVLVRIKMKRTIIIALVEVDGIGVLFIGVFML